MGTRRPDHDGNDTLRRFQALWRAAQSDSFVNIGFPGATDIDYGPVSGLFGMLFNNVGDPARAPGGSANTMQVEREVLAWFGDLFGAPADDRWGYLTSGGTEGNQAALLAARHRHPDAVAYYSAAAHYSVPKVLDILRIPAVEVHADDTGEMVYADLSRHLGNNSHLPAIVVATAGTTMTGAIDDTRRIAAALNCREVHRRFVHVDAALDGVSLALDGNLLLSLPVDSISVSGHKFFGTPIPCGLVLVRGTASARPIRKEIPYTATVDTTVSGSRCGQIALLLWYAIEMYGHQGHRDRTAAARALAGYAVEQLNAAGWRAWRHPHSFIVVFPTPPAEVTDRWTLASADGLSHLICMPGVDRDQISAFVADVSVAARSLECMAGSAPSCASPDVA